MVEEAGSNKVNQSSSPDTLMVKWRGGRVGQTAEDGSTIFRLTPWLDQCMSSQNN